MLQFAYTILYVKDVDKTLKFYQNAFGFERKFMTPEGDYGELVSGNTKIAFASLELAESNLNGGFQKSNLKAIPLGIELAFATENPETDFETAIRAGAVEFSPMQTKPWGQKVGYLRDLNGFLIEICSIME